MKQASDLVLATSCHQNGSVTDPSDDMDWQRLGRYVTKRRIELGYRTREALVDADLGIKLRTLGNIETGRQAGYHGNTLATLETALRWTTGSIAKVLRGGEPTNIDAILATNMITIGIDPDRVQRLPSDDPLVKVIQDPKLTDEQKARIIRTLIAEQQRFARERADELIHDALQDGA
jgi:hypothetical protein